jgi:hypothetical protein
MELPPAVQKGWPFALAGLILVFLAFQLSQAGGCVGNKPPPPDERWPMQTGKPPPGR